MYTNFLKDNISVEYFLHYQLQSDGMSKNQSRLIFVSDGSDFFICSFLI